MLNSDDKLRITKFTVAFIPTSHEVLIQITFNLPARSAAPPGETLRAFFATRSVEAAKLTVFPVARLTVVEGAAHGAAPEICEELPSADVLLVQLQAPSEAALRIEAFAAHDAAAAEPEAAPSLGVCSVGLEAADPVGLPVVHRAAALRWAEVPRKWCPKVPLQWCPKRCRFSGPGDWWNSM